MWGPASLIVIAAEVLHPLCSICEHPTARRAGHMCCADTSRLQITRMTTAPTCYSRRIQPWVSPQAQAHLHFPQGAAPQGALLLVGNLPGQLGSTLVQVLLPLPRVSWQLVIHRPQLGQGRLCLLLAAALLVPAALICWAQACS